MMKAILTWIGAGVVLFAVLYCAFTILIGIPIIAAMNAGLWTIAYFVWTVQDLVW